MFIDSDVRRYTSNWNKQYWCTYFYGDGNALTVNDKHIYISVSVFLFGFPQNTWGAESSTEKQKAENAMELLYSSRETGNFETLIKQVNHM